MFLYYEKVITGMRIHQFVFVLALLGLAFALPPTSLAVDVLAPEGSVNLYNGSSYDVSLNVSCPGAPCGAVNVSLFAASAPKTCKQILDDDPEATDGTYLICPSGSDCVNVYCDMTDGGYASIFEMEGDLTLDSRDCIMHNYNDDMDSVIMWTDLSTKVMDDNGYTANTQDWYTWYRNGTQDMNPAYLPNRPEGLDSYAKPVPLPAANKTIWFDFANQMIAWDGVSIPFSEAGLTSDSGGCGDGTPYFISDGIDMIHVGEMGSGVAKVLTFDFNSNSVSGTDAVGFNPPNGWWGTEEDTFGNVLFTVNGRVMYFDSYSSGQGYFALGGGLDNPNSRYDLHNVTAWTNPWQPGLDFFARVDDENKLWFGDWGHDNGGYFNCGNDEYLGVGRTNIMLTYDSAVTEDAVLVSTTTGAAPFYTSSNPRAITLSSGESAIVNYTVHATRPGVYLFFADANMTASSIAHDQSEIWVAHTYGRTNPTPSQLAPADGAYFSPSGITLNFSCNDGIIDTIKLFTNTSGAWSLAYSDSSYNEGEQASFDAGALGNGVYKWAVWCNNTIGRSAWSANRTFHVSDTGLFQCRDINEPGSYTLLADVTATYGDNCFNINSDDVVLDCAGHSISGSSCGRSGTGVYSSGDNTVVKNCGIDNFYNGVYFNGNIETSVESTEPAAESGANHGSITYNNISDTEFGVYLYYADWNSVLHNNFDDNDVGFYLYEADSNQIGLNKVNSTYTSNFGSASCPFLYTWNGTGYSFISDFSRGGKIGSPSRSSSGRSVFPAEYSRIPGDSLIQNDGAYVMKITEEYDELSYLDEVGLLTVDHSPDVDVYPGLMKENFSTFYTVSKTPSSLVSCKDDAGDACATGYEEADGVYTDRVQNMTLDLGGASKLILSIASAKEKNADGDWVSVYSGDQFTTTGGMPRTVVVDLSGRFLADNHLVRVVMPTSVFDYIAVDYTSQQPLTVSRYAPSSARMRFRGYSQSIGENSLDYNDVSSSTGFHDAAGDFTKYGDVLPLLTSTDDKYVIMNHGDEISVSFPYHPASEGMQRDFMLYSWDYYKQATDTNGSTVLPLPFKAMSSYPYPADESYPSDEDHQKYLAEWNTRHNDGGSSAGGSLPYSFNNTVYENTITGGEYSTGLYLDNEEDTTIRYNTISGVEVGVDIYDSSGTIMTGNTIRSERGRALILHQGSYGSYITSNTFHSDSSENCYFDGCGAVYLGKTNGNVLKNNRLSAIDGTGLTVGYSNDNEFTDNTINPTGEGNYAIRMWGSTDNTFLHNSMTSDYWVNNEGGGESIAADGGGNYFNDETSGNRYYFADGAGAWTFFNITDTDGDGWANEGSDLPFSCNSVGYCENDFSYWIGDGEDWHPFVGTETSSTHKDSEKTLSVDMQSNCTGNYVTVTSGGEPVSGAQVAVFDASNLGDIASGTTDENGVLRFDGCGHTMKAHVSKDGYKSVDGSSDMVSCGQCAQPECASDSDCPDTKMCSEQKCVAVSCQCGSVSQHQCNEYGCCSNSDCGQGETCQDHSCKRAEACTAPGCCTADSMCADNQNCRSATGAPGTANAPGKCNDIAGQCGTVKGHEFVPYGYECGSEPGCPACPQGELCVDHKCASNDLKGPQTGFVGDSAKVQATEGDGVCKDCDIQGTDPTGKPFTGKTGPDGSFELPLTLQGIYKVSLLKNGTVVKTIQINSLPKAPAEEPAKPTGTGGTEIFSLIGLLVLLLVVILGVVYWRGMAKKK
jgi:parallel beta-helix repeat protein